MCAVESKATHRVRRVRWCGGASANDQPRGVDEREALLPAPAAGRRIQRESDASPMTSATPLGVVENLRAMAAARRPMKSG